VEINAVLIMQTLFGFELGNYYRSVPPLPFQTEFPRHRCPHHILLIPPQSLRKQQSRLTIQGCSRPIRIHCWTWDLASSRCCVFPEREEVISCFIVLCVFIIITLISHVSVVCPISEFTHLVSMQRKIELMIMGYIPTTCYFDCYDYNVWYDNSNPLSPE
jgi:hypothetical protein